MVKRNLVDNHYRNVVTQNVLGFSCTFTVEYRVYGHFIPATYLDPPEYPEAEIESVTLEEFEWYRPCDSADWKYMASEDIDPKLVKWIEEHTDEAILLEDAEQFGSDPI